MLVAGYKRVVYQCLQSESRWNRHVGK